MGIFPLYSARNSYENTPPKTHINCAKFLYAYTCSVYVKCRLACKKKLKNCLQMKHFKMHSEASHVGGVREVYDQVLDLFWPAAWSRYGEIQAGAQADCRHASLSPESPHHISNRSNEYNQTVLLLLWVPWQCYCMSTTNTDSTNSLVPKLRKNL